MNAIQNTLPDLMSSMSSHLLSSNKNNLENLSQTESSKIDLHVQKSTDITLVTAEGDKVTLSSLSTLDAGYSRYTSQGTVEGAEDSSSSETAYLKKEFSFALSIEGDLNEQELHDIRAALKTLGKMTRDFFSGNTEKAVNRASKLVGLESISRLDAVIQYERTLSYQQTQSLAPPAPAPEKQAAIPFNDPALAQAIPVATPENGSSTSTPVKTAPSATPPSAPEAPAPPSPPETAATGSSPVAVNNTEETNPENTVKPEAPAKSAEKPMIQVDVSQLVEKMAKVVVESPADTGVLSKYTLQFFEHLSTQYSQKGDEGNLEFNLVKRIQSTLMQRIQNISETGESPSTDGSSQEKPAEALAA